jgi:DNA-binding CsgD family transcriptional regulator
MGRSWLPTALVLAFVLALTWMPLFCALPVPAATAAAGTTTATGTTSAVPTAVGIAGYLGLYRVLFYGGFVLCFAGAYLLRRRGRAVISSVFVLCGACVLTAAFTAVSLAAAYALIGVEWLLISSVTRGAATGLIFMWGLTLIARTMAETGWRTILGAMALTAIGVLTFSALYFLSIRIALAVLVACPLMLCVAVILTRLLPSAGSATRAKDEKGAARHDIYHYRRNITIAMFVVGSAMGVVLQELFSAVPTVLTGILVGTGIVLAVALVALRLRFGEPTINSFVAVRMVNPYLLCLIMLLPFAQEYVYGLMVVAIASIWTFNSLFRINICAEIAAQMTIDPLDSYGQCFLYQTTGIVMGMSLPLLFEWFSASLHPHAILIVACLLATAMSFLLIDQKSIPRWYLYRRESEPVLRESCTLVAEKHGLTAREEDVLFLLAKGRTARYVASELMISSSTVKTHMKRLYAKLDVHSQQELLDTIDRMAFRRREDIAR